MTEDIDKRYVIMDAFAPNFACKHINLQSGILYEDVQNRWSSHIDRAMIIHGLEEGVEILSQMFAAYGSRGVDEEPRFKLVSLETAHALVTMREVEAPGLITDMWELIKCEAGGRDG